MQSVYQRVCSEDADEVLDHKRDAFVCRSMAGRSSEFFHPSHTMSRIARKKSSNEWAEWKT